MLLALGLLLLLGQMSGRAHDDHDDDDASLPYSKGYLLTGNYVVGGIDLQTEKRQNGFLTGTLPMSGVPANAEILAAFLYWETVSTNIAQVNGAKFRGQPVTVVKASSKKLLPPRSSCWSAGSSGPTPTLTMFRADVLRMLPYQTDVTGNSTGRRLVNDADLLKYGLPLNTVTLPAGATGTRVPQTAGASLFVLYRDASQPLTKVVIYDGVQVLAPGEE